MCVARSYVLCVGVHMSVENICLLRICARRAIVSVENMCMHLCALSVCEFVHVIALLVRGYIALSLGNDWGDSRCSSDEANGLLPNNKLILYGKVSRSWLDVC